MVAERVFFVSVADSVRSIMIGFRGYRLDRF